MRVNSLNDNYSPYGIACVRCNDQLIAPNWSEFVSEFHVRHFWSCESCGRQFETLDDVRAAPPLRLVERIRVFPCLSHERRTTAP